VQLLLQEVRAIELLAEEAEIPPTRLQDYWQLSADLITLATDIDQFGGEHPDAEYDDPSVLALRRRVRDLASRLAELSLE
jgi:hypothetical protein